MLVAVGAFGQADSGLPEEFTAMKPALCDKPADFTETGCKVCPAFMVKDVGHPDQGGLEIRSVLFGSFTSAGKTEALLSSVSFSCFGHAEGPASAFLLHKDKGSWQRLSFFHNDGPIGICWKIPGSSDVRDLLLCNYQDYGVGTFSIFVFDADGKVKTESVLVQTRNPFRVLDKQKHCSSLSADLKTVSSSSIEISIYLNSLDVDPPIDCVESETTDSTVSNLRKIEAVAVFTRYGDTFAPDEKTKKLLAEVEKSR